MERFYIYDCNGRIVGNPKGYRTIKGAIREQDRKGSPAWRAIWASYDARENKSDTLVSSVTSAALYMGPRP
jgi:hypothetical protein